MRQKILDKLSEPSYRPLTAEELSIELGCSSRELQPLLNTLMEEGVIVSGKKGRIMLPETKGIFRGRIQGSERGFAFFVPEKKTGDMFIPPDDLNGALHNDVVLVRESVRWGRRRGHSAAPAGKRREARVTEIIERSNMRVVGTYEKYGRFGVIHPDDKRISTYIKIYKEKSLNAVTGDKVVAVIDRWHERGAPEGHITEIFGSQGDKALDVLSVVKKYNLEHDFPPEVLRQADSAAVISAADYNGRTDLRGEILVTIDGSDAQDLDDAVSLTRDELGNFVLGVHIADVAHYVRPNSALDREAWNRATSVYLPGLTIPMLPPKLSNGICSLNAGEDRLALSCIMVIDESGKQLSHSIEETVINVAKRLDYAGVNKAFAGDDTACTELGKYMLLLNDLHKLMNVLGERRTERGSIDFNFPETKVILDETGKTTDIVKRNQGIGERIIEEMMIAANEVVATEYFNRDAPFLYRVHQTFSEEKLTELNEFLSGWGYSVNTHGGKPKPQHVQKLLREIADKPEQRIISTVVLRSMNHAFYSNLPLGHFALAAPYYSHFTSPIRRYPDLAIHRVIKAYLKMGFLKEDTAERWNEEMDSTALNSSKREREAEAAEREVVALKCSEYMAEHVGGCFCGHISGVTGSGFYVELENTVEGLVRAVSLCDDYYEFDERRYLLEGRRTGKIFRLGDPVRVRIYDVDKQRGTISMELAGDSGAEEIKQDLRN